MRRRAARLFRGLPKPRRVHRPVDGLANRSGSFVGVPKPVVGDCACGRFGDACGRRRRRSCSLARPRVKTVSLSTSYSTL
eukprot:2224380-Prymnesium_polylepis.1